MPKPQRHRRRARQKEGSGIFKFASLLGFVGIAFFYYVSQQESLPSLPSYMNAGYYEDNVDSARLITPRAGLSPIMPAAPPRPKEPYMYHLEKAAYINRDFKKILRTRDFRDSIHKDRKSGQGSPRNTLGSGIGKREPLDEAVDGFVDNDSSSDDFPALPRVVSYASSRSNRRQHLRIPDKPPPLLFKRHVPWSKRQERRQKQLTDEIYYNENDHMAEDPYADYPECAPMHDWQTASYPSCNSLHSLELQESKFVANGFFRDVWAINGTSAPFVDTAENENQESSNNLAEQLAVKTLRLLDSSKHDFDARNYHRHRVDAIAYERLTSSPYVMNIYGYCGQSAIFEYAPDGDLSDALANDKGKSNFSKEERFKAALEVARSVSDLHNFNGKVPAIAHSDIWHSQFVKTKRGVFALSDFNRAQFLYWNSTSNEGSCPYYYQHTNGYPFRSPEEYKYEAQTEEIDVYSMGNIFFSLLMDKWPYEELYKKKNTYAVSKLITKGKRDKLSKELLESTDSIDAALRTAMDMCWEQDWRKRASAKDVANFLDAVQKQMLEK